MKIKSKKLFWSITAGITFIAMAVVVAGAIFLGGGEEPRTELKISITGTKTIEGTLTFDYNYDGDSFKLPSNILNFKTESGKKVNAKSIEYTVSYATADGKALPAAPTDAGNYTLTITITDKDYIGSFTCYFKINPRPVSVVVADHFININDFEIDNETGIPNYEIVYQVLDGEEDVTELVNCVTTFGNSEYTTSEEKPVNVSAYELTISVDDNNYTAEVDGEAELWLYEDAVPMFSGTLKTYTGGAQEAQIGIVDPLKIYEISDVVITYNGSTEKPVNAGSYFIEGTCILTNTLLNESEPRTIDGTSFIIQKFNISNLTGVTANNFNYTGEEIDVENDLEISGIPADFTSYSISRVADWDSIECDDIVWGGHYTFDISARAADQNYTGTSTGSFDVLVNFNTALEYYNYSNYYFKNVARHFESILSGQTTVKLIITLGTPQINNIKQKSNNNFYYETVTLGKEIVSQNPSIAVQMINENGEVSYRNDKPAASTTAKVNFSGDWKNIAGETKAEKETNYKSVWGTYPENLSNYIVADSTYLKSTPSLPAADTSGNKTITFNLVEKAVADYKNQVKAYSGNAMSSWSSASLVITFDKYGRAITIVDNCVYVVSGATSTVKLTENINYNWNQPIIRSEKDRAA